MASVVILLHSLGSRHRFMAHHTRGLAMAATDTRISARLTGENAWRFTESQRSEDLSASDLLRESLGECYAARAPARVDAAQSLMDSGFIGGGEGPINLSTRYKSYLIAELEADVSPRVQNAATNDPRR